MKKHYNIIIAGAGGIARAVGLLLAEWSEISPSIFIGNRTLSKAIKVANWIKKGTTKKVIVKGFLLPEDGITNEMEELFYEGSIILDCLPGRFAPRVAKFALDYKLHYANLTEYVSETNKIIEFVKNAQTGFILQTGLAPGYINVLGNGLFKKFCNDYSVDKVNSLKLRVGALTKHAVAPHYYGFTWSSVGVATEYIKDTFAIRNFKKVSLPALSERAKIIINGVTYEEDLTSGGAADLPDSLSGVIGSLDYKTLRYPGHYKWIQQQLSNLGNTQNAILFLQKRMESTIPYIEDDQIILYAGVEGNDLSGKLRSIEIAKTIEPQEVGNHILKAIQTTTAAPLAQAAKYLLETNPSGVILQSNLNPVKFLEGKFIKSVYGTIDF